MRRFSQRNHLVTLNDINITPLLDLAFVLLIIFVITTPLLEQGMKLTLPSGGSADGKVDKKDFKTVEIDKDGTFMLDRIRMPITTVEQELVKAFRANPKLVVRIRADELSQHRHTADILNRCQRNGIHQFMFRTQPERR